MCCIVFDIDGMLFEFVMNFLNIEKNKIFKFFCFQYFMFSSRFMLFPTFKKTIGVKNNFGGGVTIFFSFRVLCYFQQKNEILKRAPSLAG